MAPPMRRVAVAILACSFALFACDAPAEAEGAAAKPTRSEPAGDLAALDKQTCAHVVEVLGKDDADLDGGALTKLEAHCEASLDAIARRHKSLSACLLATNRLDEIEACEKPSGRFDSVIGMVATGERVCAHVMDIMKAELGDGAEKPSDEDIKKFMSKCVVDIAKEKEKVGYAMFATQSKCIMASKNMQEMMKCEKKRDE